MLDSHKYISTQIERNIPQFIRMEYPHFVLFIKAYYEWMESVGAPYQFIANILNYSDVDRTSIEFLDTFAKNFLQPLPDVVYDQNNLATLVKYIEQYYSARGSEKSMQFMFRLFEYKDDPDHSLEFYYPSYDMLRVSDGKWVNVKSIKIIDPPDDVMTWESGQVLGATSGAKGIIDEVTLYETTSGESVAEISLLEFDVIHTAEKFLCGETIEITTIDNEVGYAVLEKVFYGINITDPSIFNISGQRIGVTNSAVGEDVIAVIDHVNKGTVTSFSVLEVGTGYTVGDRVYTTQSAKDFGSGAYGKVATIGGSGEITGIDLVFGGHDYRNAQRVVIDSVSGSRAVVVVESDDIGGVQSVEVRNFGLLYETLDTTIDFNTSMRLYNIDKTAFIGEEIIGQTNGFTGIIEYWEEASNVLSVRILTGTPLVGEQVVGQRYGFTANIHDINQPEGELIEGCLCQYKGKYINDDGHISSLKYIQDSYFYQMFSYMLKTTEDKSIWGDFIKNSHPAGTIGFGYRDAISQYSNESYGGFISPSMDSTEHYKFNTWDGGWVPEPNDEGTTGDYANTQIIHYSDVVIDDVINWDYGNVINTSNIANKTAFTFGSEITIEEIV